MQYQFSQYLVLAIVTFVFVGALTPLMRKLAIKVGAVDAPNLARKVQIEPVPYLGGVAIVIGVFVATYSTVIIADKDIALASTVLIPAVVMAVMGLIDDLRGPTMATVNCTICSWCNCGCHFNFYRYYRHAVTSLYH